MTAEGIVLVTGGSRGIGAATATLLAEQGRRVVITDINEYRLALAQKVGGVTRAVNVRNTSLVDVMKELKMTEGFDIGLEMSGNAAAFRSMLDLLNNGARIALLGIFPGDVAIDWAKVVFKGLVIKGIYGREMFETWYKMATMLQSGLDISGIITHRLPVDRYEEGFKAMADGNSGKVVLDWGS